VLHADGQQELYHLIHDPNELVNLAGQSEQVDTVNALRRALMDWCQRTGDVRFQQEMETAKS
jgi:hypothetical protein